jgi:hypothetical protein
LHYDRGAVLRTRLLTSLVFNLVIAAWVFHDARARGARKPGFAAVLALMWGPLGLGFWESDRPLRAGELRRGGAAATMARGFLIGWVALLPAIFVLAMQAVEHRAAVPGSLGRQIGIRPATFVVASIVWGGPAVLALILGRLGRRSAVEQGSPATPATPAASVPSWVAAALAGVAAFACALLVTRNW